MKKIIALIIVLLALFSAYYFLFSKENKVNLPFFTEGEISYKEWCKESEYLNIPDENDSTAQGIDENHAFFKRVTDENHIVVQEAKKILLSGMSKEYLDSYFKFECARTKNFRDERISSTVIFKFSIAEYTTEISILEIKGKPYQNWSEFDEVREVIDKEQALSKLKSCLGNNPEQITVNLAPGGRFYIRGINPMNEMEYDWAEVDLETGDCRQGKYSPGPL